MGLTNSHGNLFKKNEPSQLPGLVIPCIENNLMHPEHIGPKLFLLFREYKTNR